MYIYIYIRPELVNSLRPNEAIWRRRSWFTLVHRKDCCLNAPRHYSDIIMSTKASQITAVLMGCSIVRSGTDQTKHQSSVQLDFVRGIHRWPVDSPHKGPVTRAMFPFDDVITWTNCDVHQRDLLALLTGQCLLEYSRYIYISPNCVWDLHISNHSHISQGIMSFKN